MLNMNFVNGLGWVRRSAVFTLSVLSLFALDLTGVAIAHGSLESQPDSNSVSPAQPETISLNTNTENSDPVENSVLLAPHLWSATGSNVVQIAQQRSGSRSLEVISLRGSATYGTEERTLAIGDRLNASTQIIRTGNNSSLRLAIESDLGILEVAENTSFQITTLSEGETVLSVSEGQVRMSVASIFDDNSDFTSAKAIHNPTLQAQRNSSGDYPVRIQTPAGIAGVRGTSFGVTVDVTGQTGVATIDGSVAAIAQGQEVIVNRGESVVINPGLAPTQPAKTPQEAGFESLILVKMGSHRVRVLGQVEPMDIVYINNQLIETDSEGRFSTYLEIPPSRRLQFVVRGPEVRQRYFELSVL